MSSPIFLWLLKILSIYYISEKNKDYRMTTSGPGSESA
jgi:hypothetical protein